MAKAKQVPDAWIGNEVNLRYVAANRTPSLNCTIEGVSRRGVSVTADEQTTFFPWSSVVRIDLGHKAEQGGSELRASR